MVGMCSDTMYSYSERPTKPKMQIYKLIVTAAHDVRIPLDQLS